MIGGDAGCVRAGAVTEDASFQARLAGRLAIHFGRGRDGGFGKGEDTFCGQIEGPAPSGSETSSAQNLQMGGIWRGIP